MTSVDWSRPIEAVHEDGRVVPAKVSYGPDNDGDYVIEAAPDSSTVHGWRPDGSPYDGNYSPWRIRNVQPTTPERDPALWDRMEALVRLIGERSEQFFVYNGDAKTLNRWIAEASAIVADLPKPVDPDLIEAREIAAGLSKPNAYISFSAGESSARLIREGCMDDGLLVTGLLAALRRGRELAAPEVSHVG